MPTPRFTRLPIGSVWPLGRYSSKRLFSTPTTTGGRVVLARVWFSAKPGRERARRQAMHLPISWTLWYTRILPEPIHCQGRVDGMPIRAIVLRV